MVGTHADSLIAEAVLKGIVGFDLELAYEAVHKDATVPPANDNTTE
jgi:putative alpha-1,2-mannosidase